MKVRPPAVAGSFYPSDPETLRKQIRDYFEEVPQTSPPPKAIIAPHAGTIYSGSVAATAYKALLPIQEQIKRVVLLGPAHRVPFEGLAASSAEAFATPLGEIPIDSAAVAQACELPQVQIFDEAHREEHSLELHLPFLQEVLTSFSLVPFVVGYCEPQIVAEVLSKLWSGEETLIVVSSDLSHYHPYDEARKLDGKTAAHIERLEWKQLAHDSACGFFPVRGLLYAIQQKGLEGHLVDLRNSGDTAGTKEGVVGYGSFLFN